MFCDKMLSLFAGGENGGFRFYEYPSCGTCRKAKKWLEEHNKDINSIHIVEETPDKETLKALYEKSGLELKKFLIRAVRNTESCS